MTEEETGVGGTGTVTITEEETEAKSGYYPKWKVIIHNDDKTTMDFVTEILMRFFNKDHIAAMKLMILFSLTFNIFLLPLCLFLF